MARLCCWKLRWGGAKRGDVTVENILLLLLLVLLLLGDALISGDCERIDVAGRVGDDDDDSDEGDGQREGGHTWQRCREVLAVNAHRDHGRRISLSKPLGMREGRHGLDVDPVHALHMNGERGGAPVGVGLSGAATMSAQPHLPPPFRPLLEPCVGG